jgi:hypothetical protein
VANFSTTKNVAKTFCSFSFLEKAFLLKYSFGSYRKRDKNVVAKKRRHYNRHRHHYIFYPRAHRAGRDKLLLCGSCSC